MLSCRCTLRAADSPLESLVDSCVSAHTFVTWQNSGEIVSKEWFVPRCTQGLHSLLELHGVGFRSLSEYSSASSVSVGQNRLVESPSRNRLDKVFFSACHCEHKALYVRMPCCPMMWLSPFPRETRRTKRQKENVIQSGVACFGATVFTAFSCKYQLMLAHSFVAELLDNTELRAGCSPGEHHSDEEWSVAGLAAADQSVSPSVKSFAESWKKPRCTSTWGHSLHSWYLQLLSNLLFRLNISLFQRVPTTCDCSDRLFTVFCCVKGWSGAFCCGIAAVHAKESVLFQRHLLSLGASSWFVQFLCVIWKLLEWETSWTVGFGFVSATESKVVSQTESASDEVETTTEALLRRSCLLHRNQPQKRYVGNSLWEVLTDKCCWCALK